MQAGGELKIKIFGDPALRKRAGRVKEITGWHREILSQMSQLMYRDSGVGLAASQVGINAAMLVADTGSGLYKLINPKIVRKKGRQAIEEGCLSIPGVSIKVKRAKEISVEALDEDARPVSIEAQDLLACVLQHEVDHLQGRLIVDYAPFLDRLKIKKKLKALKNRPQDEKLPEAKRESQLL